MRALLCNIGKWIGRSLASLRYRVRVNGLEKLDGLKGPILVMPNHPGYVDPLIILCTLGQKLALRPLVFSGIYRSPLFYPLMLLVDALEVPDLQQQSQSARSQTEEVIRRMVAGLKEGGSFLIYPSGRLQRRGNETVGATRAAAEVLQTCPETTVVLVRTVGLWGSMSGWGMTGKAPDLFPAMLKAIALMLANFIFFMPRREVHITIEVFKTSDMPGLQREVLNPWLEKYYNAELVRNPVWVPYHFLFGPRTYDFPKPDGFPEVPLEKITKETREGVIQILSEKLKRPLSDQEQSPDAPLDSLGLDSLDRMELGLQLEQRFGFRSDLVPNTLGELWMLAQGLVSGGDDKPLEAPSAWTKTPLPKGRAVAEGENILESFVRVVLRQPQSVAVADDLSGVLTYEKLLTSVTILSRRIAQVEGDAVGILLPSSVASTSVYFATLMAGKLPVYMNWTTGPANLAHAAATVGLRKVITSRKFIDRLGIEVKGAEFFFLEDLRKDISNFEKIRTLLQVRFFGRGILHSLPQKKGDDPAVVLFTSGSEKAPKAVPLTHRNILSNIKASAEIGQITSQDSMLSFLPPFHSFGLVIATILPMVSGMRMIHHPDPTDARALSRKIAAYRPTFFIGTPTFITYILAVSKPGDFDSVRTIVTGAEKCPDRIFEELAKIAPRAEILEGYGITECSPVVAANYPGKTRRGTVGWPAPGVEISLADPETLEPIKSGSMGMLLVAGPSIFGGYLKYDGPSPFVQRDGKIWYVTGDLVELDAEKYIHFRGRLKRFIKAGGEMISLPAIEEPLARQFAPTKDGPQLAVEGIEAQGGGRKIVLFSTFDISLAQANAILTEAGLRGLMRLDEVRRIEKVPVLGTGKTDYKILRAMIEKTITS